ncbi:hypothetical protein [Microbispora sp. NPDC046933]|uniref:collagen-like triple helix repeat-containing protein n=1 Tax=Microbispora sp. NPDC046933 TaxID=3155618 RepID=UPI0033D82FD4
MSVRTGRSAWLAAGAVAGLLVGGGGVAVATTAATTSPIVACVGADGVMRMPRELESAKAPASAAQIAAPTATPTLPAGACFEGEETVTWNVTGPQGPRGLTGSPGPQGPQGEKGEKGDPGAAYGQTYIAYGRHFYYHEETPQELVRIPQVPAGNYAVQVAVSARDSQAFALECEVSTPTGVTSYAPRQQSGTGGLPSPLTINYFVTAKLNAPGPVVVTCDPLSEVRRVIADGRLMATSVPEVVAWPSTTPTATPSTEPTPAVTPSAGPTPTSAVTPSAAPPATPSAMA